MWLQDVFKTLEDSSGMGAELLLLAIVGTYFVSMTALILVLRRLQKRNRRRVRVEAPRESYRRRLDVWLFVTTDVGGHLDLAQSFLSLVSCGIYVWETYQPPPPEDVQDQPMGALDYVEVFLGFFFLADYMIRFYVAKDRLMYLYSLFGLLDVLTVLPIFLYFFVQPIEKASVPMYLRLVRLVKLLRVLRSLRILRASLGGGIRRRVYTLGFSACSLIFLAAGIFQFIEEHGAKPVDFHVALYYSTIETLGRPRVDCGTSGGFAWLMALVALSVVLIPKQLADLLSVMKNESVYARQGYDKHSETHVVVTGHQDFGSVNCLLYEFYHPDRGYHSCDVVLFFEESPTREVEMLLEHPAYMSHVQYVQGSPLVEKDLDRVKLSTASAYVVLANKNPSDPSWEDCRITSSVLACKAYWRRDAIHSSKHANARRRVHAQVLRAETREQLLRTPGWRSDDVILVISEFTSVMVGLNAIYRGLTTLIFNLFSHVEEQQSAPKWYRNYERGATQEIYCVVVKDSLAGASVSDAAAYMLLEKHVVLVAVEALREDGETKHLVLYPGDEDMKLKDGDLVYCIAQNVSKLFHTAASADLEIIDHADSKSSFSFASIDSVKKAAGLSVHPKRVNLNSSAIGFRVREQLANCFSDSDEDGNMPRSDFKDYPDAKRAIGDRSPEKRIVDSDVGGRSFAQGENDMGDNSGIPTERGQGEAPPGWHAVSDEGRADVRRLLSTRRLLAPNVTEVSNTSGRQLVLDWLLRAGYAGNLQAMQLEFGEFLRLNGSKTSTSHSGGSEIPASNETGNDVVRCIPNSICDHIVVFGLSDVSALNDLARIVLELKPDRSIVVLSPDAKRIAEAATDIRPLRRATDRIFFVSGSLSHAGDLKRVRLQFASAAIFLPCLPPKGAASDTATERQHRMIDSTTVARTNFAAQHTHLWTVTQLLHGSSVNFFSDKSSWRSASADPRWLDVTPLNTHALFAAGQIVASTMLDRLLIETYFNQKAIPLIGLFIFGDACGSRLFPIPLPEQFAGECYSELCKNLLREKRQLLPIGLLRDGGSSYSNLFHGNTSKHLGHSSSSGVSLSSKPEVLRAFLRSTTSSAPAALDTSEEAQLPYIITNPDPDLLLEKSDLIFVIGQPVKNHSTEEGGRASASQGPSPEASTSVGAGFLWNFHSSNLFMFPASESPENVTEHI